MKERPIIFNGEMVRAILAGRKTQTRVAKKSVKCPYGTVGDRLWVRESYAVYRENPVLYRASCVEDKSGKHSGVWQDGEFYPLLPKWKSAMPRWASRITLEITDVRVHRIQDISESDANAEGVSKTIDINGKIQIPAWKMFSLLWDSINAERGYSWDSNPFVWAITFKRIKP